MTNSNISYLITCKNDEHSLDLLLSKIINFLGDNDEIIVLDDYSDNQNTLDVFEKYKCHIKLYKHHLNNNYSEHKNWGKNHCKNHWIFQIDSDEVPSDFLMENIKDVIEANPDVECFLIPRINDFIGVNENHAKHWGWRLSSYKDRLIVNFPDYQFRLFKNIDRLKWERPLHEKIEGALVTTKLPPEFEWALTHNKTIEKQVQTNLRYNKDFSEELNKGFKI